jgi:MraZ protein
MFRGNHPTRVDEKGRLKIPADFKRLIDENYGTQFYVTSIDGKGADVYPLQEWEKFEKKLAELPNFSVVKKKLLGIVSYYGHMTEMDAQGRILIPQILREKANVIGDMVVLGMQNHLRVVNREAYERELTALTLEDEKELAQLGL